MACDQEKERGGLEITTPGWAEILLPYPYLIQSNCLLIKNLGQTGQIVQILNFFIDNPVGDISGTARTVYY